MFLRKFLSACSILGTLGFFHDRTINLIGEVNPEALRAKLADGDVISYILASKIEFLVDWANIARLAKIKKNGFNQKFKLIVDDKDDPNLAVFRRVVSQGQLGSNTALDSNPRAK